MIKKFNEFNESVGNTGVKQVSVRDLLKPKSTDDIPLSVKLEKGHRFGYIPTPEEWKKAPIRQRIDKSIKFHRDIPEDEWREYINSRPISKIGGALSLAAECGSLVGVEIALEMGADPSFNENHAMRMAGERGDIDMVKMLIKYGVDPSIYDNCLLKMYYNIKTLPLLLSDERVTSKLSEEELEKYKSKLI
jgi:hypothetical protein